jgi:uncharacterized protein (DUF1800 family)
MRHTTSERKPWRCIAMLGVMATIAVQAQASVIFGDGFEASTTVSAAEDAARLLAQGSFGPTFTEIDAIAQTGPAAWIDQQIALPPSSMLSYMRERNGSGGDPEAPIGVGYFTEAWFDRALRAPDQLRLRVAFALSEIMVVSERGGGLSDDGLTLGGYYDLLIRHAFGNYRELLEAVTLSPAMGRYLSMYRNRKSDPAQNIRADENYAREVLQLFSIGLVRLNRDGSVALAGGAAVPTYDEQVVRGFAQVFTGWGCDGFPFEDAVRVCISTRPMRPTEQYHDVAEKRLFNGVVLPAGRDARSDLEAALDAIFMHPNVPPFISRQLIQKLVTSNPTPTYVERVATVFENNGSGVRGDLGAVVRAILLDVEARSGHRTLPDRFGKLREPLLRRVQLWRSHAAVWNTPQLILEDYNIIEVLGQAALMSPSVFNFFAPHHVPAGVVADAGMVAPEMQALTDTWLINLTNDGVGQIFYAYIGGPFDDDPRVRRIDLSAWMARMPAAASAAQMEAFIDAIDLLVTQGGMSPPLRAAIRSRISALPGDDRLGRVQNALYLAYVSPDFAVQR